MDPVLSPQLHLQEIDNLQFAALVPLSLPTSGTQCHDITQESDNSVCGYTGPRRGH